MINLQKEEEYKKLTSIKKKKIIKISLLSNLDHKTQFEYSVSDLTEYDENDELLYHYLSWKFVGAANTIKIFCTH